jgi:hypothetical protein
MTTAIEPRLPKQVQNAAAKARQILDEQKVQREKPAAPNGVELIENTEVPIPSLNTAPNGDKAGEKPAPQPAAVDEKGRDLAYWRHNAQTLDGALRSARAKHAATVSDLNSQIATLKTQLRDAQEALIAAAPVDPKDHFTQEEIETLGENEARIMAAKIAAAQRNAVKAVRAEVEAAAPAPKPAPAAPADEPPSVEDPFFSELDRLVPNWEKINKDARWLKFCATTDTKTGLRIQELLDAAQNSGNAAAAAKIFKDFEASLNVVESAPQPPAPVADNAGGRDVGAPPPPSAANGRPSQDEIAEHFKNRKLYFHKPEHPKHIPDDRHKAFLARLQSAA